MLTDQKHADYFNNLKTYKRLIAAGLSCPFNRVVNRNIATCCAVKFCGVICDFEINRVTLLAGAKSLFKI